MKLQPGRNRLCESGKESGDVSKIVYVEFYSGIGGWTFALREALNQLKLKGASRSFNLECREALDHSDLCQTVFHHNVVVTPKEEGSNRRTVSIEALTIEQVQEWDASVWALSPPCQPHTRQHNRQDLDLVDDRSKSFLHICDMLQYMNYEKLPGLILMENVIGFESSGSCKRWRDVLSRRSYVVRHFHLSPTQLGIPNDRPRYFCIASKSTRSKVTTDESKPIDDHKREAPAMDSVTESDPVIETRMPFASTVDKERMLCLADFLDSTGEKAGDLQIPEKLLQTSASWCFDIVVPTDRRSACFTHSYGRFIRGTGSVLYIEPFPSAKSEEAELERSRDRERFQLVPPEKRQYNPNWADGLDLANNLRYFSGIEIARLMGFPVGNSGESYSSFSFPGNCTIKQQWKLLGNSLNVRVAAHVAELGLQTADLVWRPS